MIHSDIDYEITRRARHENIVVSRFIRLIIEPKRVVKCSALIESPISVIMIISVFTTDTRGAGTNANVFIQVYDFNGKRSEEISLDNKTDNFEPGQTDRFTLNIPQDLETLYKIRIWHDGSRPFAGWHLDKGEF